MREIVKNDKYDIVKSTGKVIGEFVCDRIEYIDESYADFDKGICELYIKQSCCSTYYIHELYRILCNGAYVWHISNPVIYENPMELSDFYNRGNRSGKINQRMFGKTMKVTTNSWCYVDMK